MSDDIDLEYTPTIRPISRPTICKCGLAKSYHPRLAKDHEYEPRYPEAVTIHLTREDAEYALDSLLAPETIGELLAPETIGEKDQRNRVKAAIRAALAPSEPHA